MLFVSHSGNIAAGVKLAGMMLYLAQFHTVPLDLHLVIDAAAEDEIAVRIDVSGITGAIVDKSVAIHMMSKQRSLAPFGIAPVTCCELTSRQT